MAKPDPTRAHFYPDAMSDMWTKLTPQLLAQGFMDAMPHGVQFHSFFPPPDPPPGYGAPTTYRPTQAPPTSIADQPRLGPAAAAYQSGGGQTFSPGYTANPYTGMKWLEPANASPQQLAAALMRGRNG